MRQNQFNDEFQQTIIGITSVVTNLIAVSSPTLAESSKMSKGQRERGTEILDSLKGCNMKLSDLGSSMMESNSSQKPSKQKLATAAYEVAKYTKELVSLLDANSN